MVAPSMVVLKSLTPSNTISPTSLVTLVMDLMNLVTSLPNPLKILSEIMTEVSTTSTIPSTLISLFNIPATSMTLTVVLDQVTVTMTSSKVPMPNNGLELIRLVE